MIRTNHRPLPRALFGVALCTAAIAAGAIAPTADAGWHWQPAPAPTTTAPETTTVIGGTTTTDPDTSTAWTGAGGGWNGGSWRDADTTWTPAAAASVQLRELHVDRPAISPNGDGDGDTVDISLRLARSSAAVRVLVRDGAGTTVRDLGMIRSGTRSATVTWDGTTTAGATAPDGSYAIAIVADGASAATASGPTLDISVDVDTTAPSATASRPSLVQLKALAKRAGKLRDAKAWWAKAKRTRHGNSRHRGWNRDEQKWIDLWTSQQLRIPMTVKVGEDATVQVTSRIAGRSLSFSTWRQAGRHTINVGFAAYKPGATASVTFAVADEAGNVHRHTVAMKLPAMPAARKLRSDHREQSGSNAGGGSTAAPVTNVPTNTKGPLPDWLDPIMQRATYAAGVPLAWASSNALYQIISHESSFRPTAQNPTSTAYGMFQFLNTTWATVGCTKTSDAYQQSVCGLRYIQRRYHTPEAAWKFWQAHNWY
jgi:hypothetical protein